MSNPPVLIRRISPFHAYAPNFDTLDADCIVADSALAHAYKLLQALVEFGECVGVIALHKRNGHVVELRAHEAMIDTNTLAEHRRRGIIAECDVFPTIIESAHRIFDCKRDSLQHVERVVVRIADLEFVINATDIARASHNANGCAHDCDCRTRAHDVTETTTTHVQAYGDATWFERMAARLELAQSDDTDDAHYPVMLQSDDVLEIEIERDDDDELAPSRVTLNVIRSPFAARKRQATVSDADSFEFVRRPRTRPFPN